MTVHDLNYRFIIICFWITNRYDCYMHWTHSTTRATVTNFGPLISDTQYTYDIPIYFIEISTVIRLVLSFHFY